MLVVSGVEISAGGSLACLYLGLVEGLEKQYRLISLADEQSMPGSAC